MWFLPLFSRTHTVSHLNWEGKWPGLPLSLDAAPDLRRTLTGSSELSSSPLSGPSLSSVTTHTSRLMLCVCSNWYSVGPEWEKINILMIPFSIVDGLIYFKFVIVKFGCISSLSASLLDCVTGTVSEVLSLPTACASVHLSSPSLPVNLPSVCCGL